MKSGSKLRCEKSTGNKKMNNLRFEIRGIASIPKWEDKVKKSVGGLGWKKVTCGEWPPDLAVTDWIMCRIGRPSRPVISQLRMGIADDMTGLGDKPPTVGRTILVQAHNGESLTWSPIIVASVDVAFVVPPGWKYCIGCFRIRDEPKCDCIVGMGPDEFVKECLASGVANGPH